MKRLHATGLVFLLCLTSPAALAQPTFHEACALGEVAAVREYLAAGADPNGTDEHGGRPLSYVIQAGVEAPLSSHLKVAELLAEAGASLDAAGKPEGDAWPPLHATLEKGAPFEELTWLLLRLGADPNLSASGTTPLHIAARDKASPLQLRLLLDAGADPKIKDLRGRSAFSVLVTSPNPSLEKARLLLDSGADPNETRNSEDGQDVTALMDAAENAAPDLVRLLLSRGALFHLSDSNGRTAFDHAVAARREDNAALLR